MIKYVDDKCYLAELPIAQNARAREWRSTLAEPAMSEMQCYSNLHLLASHSDSH